MPSSSEDSLYSDRLFAIFCNIVCAPLKFILDRIPNFIVSSTNFLFKFSGLYLAGVNGKLTAQNACTVVSPRDCRSVYLRETWLGTFTSLFVYVGFVNDGIKIWNIPSIGIYYFLLMSTTCFYLEIKFVFSVGFSRFPLVLPAFDFGWLLLCFWMMSSLLSDGLSCCCPLFVDRSRKSVYGFLREFD